MAIHEIASFDAKVGKFTELLGGIPQRGKQRAF
jgi:hypothetical protein